MSSSNAPIVKKILQEKGEINDELDFALMNYLLTNRGTGYTACQPQLVELDNSNKAIKMNIDHTFIDNDNQLMGLGIVGTLFIDYDALQVIFCSSSEDLVNNIEKLKNAGIKPQPRPKGKY
ncbi:MAG: hypothetical protein KGD70_08615 [Candidatus Lokiarchaeota archaeon]|jgi:hypothetical protein|nr:hypothetical protein [Candidatus Lokiarchaeota archaeon]